MRASFAVGVLAAVLVIAPAHADGPRTGAGSTGLRFLGSDPIGPLAIVQGGVVKKPGERTCRSWGPVGSRWSELDTFGGIAGAVTIKRREYYEYSGCDELYVRGVEGHRGAGVFVDARAPYQPPQVKAWQPGQDATAALETLARAHQKGIKNLLPALKVPFERRVLFFEWSATSDRYAVVGGQSLIVARFRSGGWEISYEQKPEKMRSQDEGYRALVVTDMNADGLPEIVVHHKEEQGEWYGDFTLSRGTDGVWREIGAGIFGSTA